MGLDATLHQKQTSPPPATAALGLAMAVLSFSALAMDTTTVVTLEQVGGSPEIGTFWLCVLRSATALGHIGCMAYTAHMEPLAVILVYKHEMGSHLKPETVLVQGLARLVTFFTIWTFAAQTLYLVLAAGCSAALAASAAVPSRVLFTTHLLFELTAGCCFLLTAVVTFAIWPEFVRKKVTHDLTEPQNLVMHNWNVAVVLNELLVAQVPITPSHAAVGVAWGTAFIIVSWLRAPVLARLAREGKRGRSEGNGGNFAYFFLDWTLPVATQYAFLLGLLATLLLFYFGSMALRALLVVATERGVPLLVRAAGTYSLGFCIFKWRD